MIKFCENNKCALTFVTIVNRNMALLGRHKCYNNLKNQFLNTFHTEFNTFYYELNKIKFDSNLKDAL